MPYIYRVTRRSPPNATANPAQGGVTAADPIPAETFKAVAADLLAAEDEPSYRDLQAQAKGLGIPANQTADDLKKAISEAEDG